MITHNLFPTPLSYFEFGRDLTQTELNFIKGQETRPSEGNLISVDSYLFKRPELTEISEFCVAAANEFMHTIYSPKSDVSLYVTQSWANFSSKGQFHHRHEHPNSFVSGVFYVNAIQDVDKISFYKTGYTQLQLKAKEFNLYNSSTWWMPVKTGQLILFPSSLSHLVPTVETDDTRISIAFNTFFKGYAGDEYELYAVHL